MTGPIAFLRASLASVYLRHHGFVAAPTADEPACSEFHPDVTRLLYAGCLQHLPDTLPMRDPITMPDSVIALMNYVEDAGWIEHAELVVQIMMSSVHPDVESSVATAALLPYSLRVSVANFLSDILTGNFSDEQRHAIFAWTQCWALASLDQ